MMKENEVLDNVVQAVQQSVERYQALCSRIIDIEKIAHERIGKHYGKLLELEENVNSLNNYMHMHDARLQKLEEKVKELESSKLDVLE